MIAPCTRRRRCDSLAGQAVLLHPQHAVEAARGDAHVALVAEAVVGRARRDAEQHGQAPIPRPGVDPGEAHRRQQRQHHEAGAELVVAAERERRHHGHQQPAERAAGGHREIERRQPARRRPQPVQLAVAEEAAEEQARQEDAELQRQVELEIVLDQQPPHRPDPQQQHGPEPFAPVPALALEGDDEAREVEGQRREPEQRHRGDVLRQVVGHREQQHRARRGEREPQDDIASWRSGQSRCSRRRSPAAFGVSHATAAHSTAKPANSHDHRLTCPAPPRLGSTRNG